ncbi:hypothetical protein COT97_00685 [Candidatus Falkowbacteria bacterium CG10_big_fil_rev_8_21_14_0_10_39_11]|uniref:Uncharacterized protein n=1 Tax=Candidatus Falkowbacteria bacterium CG10_big_fil_rev_8_21_14_0_10_39_11 TaxID=1974565 RepID=A0A2H0V613_9BACT|nr:MAG: hypothetical protein COT97_00685 [Candidatus Falkowbacteria bacterium CG10_big_fil_rev_8_21_14_0_10_39_11]
MTVNGKKIEILGNIYRPIRRTWIRYLEEGDVFFSVDLEEYFQVTGDNDTGCAVCLHLKSGKPRRLHFYRDVVECVSEI